MTVEVSPAFIQANTYSAEITRRALYLGLARGSSIGSVLGGISAPTDAQITAGTALHVEVSPGEVVVPGSSSATQSGYYLRVSSTETLSIAAADPTNPRIDRVSAIVKDKAYTGAEDTGTLAVQTGTPTSGATLINLEGKAAAPTSSLTLGYVLVPAKATSLEGADIANRAGLLVPGLQSATYREGTAAARPAAGVKGRIWYATDTGVYSFDTGSTWVEESVAHTLESLNKVEESTGGPRVRLEPWGNVKRFTGLLVANANIPSETRIFTLPTAYRPAVTRYINILDASTGAQKTLTIASNGEAKMVGAEMKSPEAISLDGATYT